ncbi:DNA-3-methyladenine glycosylase family protein [Spirillospora sp. CA-253888]
MSETLVLPAVPPFDFGATLWFLEGFTPSADAQRVGGGALTRALRAGGRTVVARVTAEGDAAVRCELHADGPLEPDAVEEAADRITLSLGLEDDLAGFYEIARDDPDFAPIAERLHGYHQARFTTPLEAMVWSILTQRNTHTMTVRGRRALAADVGAVHTVDGVPYTAFPDVEQLAALPPGRVAELIGNQRKGRFLADALRAWLEVDEDFLRTAPYRQAKKVLLDLPGVGPWSATFIMIRGLGRTDETPVEKQLVEPASRVYGQPLSQAQIQKIGGRYGPWAGLWAHYLRIVG